MTRRFSICLIPVCIGLLLTQFFFTGMVHDANRALWHHTRSILAAGYLAVPNAHILPSLRSFQTALAGGLFFTLTVGLVLSAAAVTAAWITAGCSRNRRVWQALLTGGTITCLWLINTRGANPVVSVWFLTAAVSVYAATAFLLPKAPPPVDARPAVVLGLCAALAGAVWIGPWDTGHFIAVRDRLLLSNPVGRHFSEIYYRYTLYPAEVIKPMAQRQITTCTLTTPPSFSKARSLKRLLADRDVLVVENDPSPHLDIAVSEALVSFWCRGRKVAATSPDALFQHPEKILDTVSISSDRQWFLRRMIGFSLQWGLPAIFFAMAGWILSRSFSALRRPGPKRWAAVCALALAAGAAGISRHHLSAPEISPDAIATALHSPDTAVRTQALRLLTEQGTDPLTLLPAPPAAPTASVPERLWWAKALGASRKPAARDVLYILLNDPQANVRCMAYEALGRHGNPADAGPIRDGIRRSDHWYVQWYAYRTLKRLGWHQSLSP